MLEELKVDAAVHLQVSKMLYINLLTDTEDEANHRVKAIGSSLAFESMRYIMFKAKIFYVEATILVRIRPLSGRRHR